MHHFRAFTNSVASAARDLTGDLSRVCGESVNPGRQYRVREKTYTEERLLSEGGFGFVYLVRETMSHNPFVVKRILCQDKERLAMAMREVEIFETLPKSTNLVKYYGHCIEMEGRFKEVILLLEYCPGGHVYDLMQKYSTSGGLPSEKIIKVLLDTCKGLVALHAMTPPVQHRDLKLENIVLNSCGDYVLLDFGSWSSFSVPDTSLIAKPEFSKLEETIERYTTLMYRPPEMADLYKGFEVSAKVDMWMLGCILFTLLNNKHPFQDASTLAIVNCRYTMDMDHICKEKQYSHQLVDLCYWLLAQNPKDRPSSEQVLRLLVSGAISENEQVLPLPESVIERLEKDQRLYGLGSKPVPKRVSQKKQFSKDVWQIDESVTPSDTNSLWEPDFLTSKPPAPPIIAPQELPDLLG